MIARRSLLAGLAAGLATVGSLRWLSAGAGADEASGQTFAVAYGKPEWRKRLTAEQYAVLRESGTERPFTSPLLNEHRRGTFTCAGCAQEAFASTTKFDSGTGWPSFWAPIEGGVGETVDKSFMTTRTAIHCSRCGGHLGHVFNDGPKPTGLRYCMNGVALGFTPAAA